VQWNAFKIKTNMKTEANVFTMNRELPQPDPNVDIVVGEVAAHHNCVMVVLVRHGQSGAPDQGALRLLKGN
jgi:hypothetical protein